MKLIQALAVAMLVTACSSESPTGTREVVLRYGKTAVPAKIRKDGTFETRNDFELETVVFSGSVSEQNERFRIDLAFSRQMKNSDSLTELDTTVLLMANESATVGGVNNEVYRVALE